MFFFLFSVLTFYLVWCFFMVKYCKATLKLPNLHDKYVLTLYLTNLLVLYIDILIIKIRFSIICNFLVKHPWYDWPPTCIGI